MHTLKDIEHNTTQHNTHTHTHTHTHTRQTYRPRQRRKRTISPQLYHQTRSCS